MRKVKDHVSDSIMSRCLVGLVRRRGESRVEVGRVCFDGLVREY